MTIIEESKEFGRSHHQVSVALLNSAHFWLMITYLQGIHALSHLCLADELEGRVYLLCLASFQMFQSKAASVHSLKL